MMPLFESIGNFLTAPAVSFCLVCVGFVLVLRFRRVLLKPRVAGSFGLAMLVVLGIGMRNLHFRRLVFAPDNIAIVGMLASVTWFTWFALRKGVANDERRREGRKTFEEEDGADRVFTWPDLVYIELIAAVLCTALLVAWSILVKAPLEAPADPTVSPNPSKAPWYFLGLQEMLVYFDPWMAGVVLPMVIIFGLLLIPYLDTNPRGNGYYTFEERAPEIAVFLFGFLVLWVYLIGVGTFLRGPNWTFFGPFERWDPMRFPVLVNLNLSDFFWNRWLGRPLPLSPVLRELPGLFLLGGWFLGLPLLLCWSRFGPYRKSMGIWRYRVAVSLLLLMGLLPVKMMLRWLFNLKYIVSLPELALNL